MAYSSCVHCFRHLPRAHRDLHSFPTRRSSDLVCRRSGKLLLNRQRQTVIINLPRESPIPLAAELDRKSTRLNSSHVSISYAVFCLKKKKTPAAHYASLDQWASHLWTPCVLFPV